MWGGTDPADPGRPRPADTGRPRPAARVTHAGPHRRVYRTLSPQVPYPRIMTTLPELLVDLEAEYDDLQRMVEVLADDESGWLRSTPASGWAIRDQISHLAYFDEAAHLAVTEPQKFSLMAEAFMAQSGDPMEAHLTRGRAMKGAELLVWWDRAHRGMAEAFDGADPKGRVPWFGPPMGALSFVSERLMETWAHGQDVADALGVERVATDRLRHIAHLGVKARPFSYVVRGRQAPLGRISILLEAPTGVEWTWEVSETSDGSGSESVKKEPGSVISGPALAFCLVVTQRRNVADTALNVRGDVANEWISIAQAFAGPPGPGRAAMG
jgi:uncharacterized protein (TIGR03084 family)